MAKTRRQRKLETGLNILKSIRPSRFRRFGARLECVRLAREIAEYLHLPFAKAATRSYHRRVKAWLAAEYADVVEAWRKPPEAEPAGESRRIWSFWYQGLDGAPEIVRRCADSMRRNCGGAEITVIDRENMSQYVALDARTRDGMESGWITVALLSDFLRLSLLYEYGGFWMDANIWVNRPLAEDIFDRPFFTVHNPSNYRGNSISEGRWTGFLMAARRHSPAMGFARDLFLNYFHRENLLIDYFLIDCVLALGYDSFPWFRALVDAAPETPEYSPYRLHPILEGTDRAALEEALRDPAQPFYKLTHKAKYAQYPEGQLSTKT